MVYIVMVHIVMAYIVMVSSDPHGRAYARAHADICARARAWMWPWIGARKRKCWSVFAGADAHALAFVSVCIQECAPPLSASTAEYGPAPIKLWHI